MISMARPLRIEYSGAFYHVINRGLTRREYLHGRQRPAELWARQKGSSPLLAKNVTTESKQRT